MLSKKKNIVLICLWILLLVQCKSESRNLESYYTNPTRTQNVQTLCEPFNMDRSQLVDDKALAESEVYRDMMRSYFSVSGNQIISGVVRDPASGVTIVMDSLTDFILFIGAFLVGLLIILFLWAFLACCCCCPASCPSQCCRNSITYEYSNCEMYWPSIVLILSLLVGLGAGIAGLIKAGDMRASVQATSCSVAILLDDMINGNVTTDEKFFIGIRTLGNELQTLNNKINQIYNQIDAVSSDGSTIAASSSEASNTKNSIDLIPSNSAGGRVADFDYETPFDGTSGSGSALASIMPDILGDSSDPGTLVFLAYAEIGIVQDSIDEIASTANTFQSSISDFNSSIDTVTDTVNDLATTLETIDSQTYGSIAETIQSFSSITYTAVNAMFGILVSCSSLGLIAVIVMTFFSQPCCRYLLYAVCWILFLMGVIGFIVSSLFSVVVPAIFFSCQFIDYSISSADNFNENFGEILGDNVDYFSECLASQSGDFISVIGGDTTTTLTSLHDTVESMDDFDSTALIDNIGTQWDNLLNFMTDYYTGAIFDFDSSSDVDILEQLADPTAYSCTSGTFQTDSWIPTNRDGAAISCHADAGANQAGSSQCPDSATIQASSGSCNGCMDSSQTLLVSDGDGGIVSDLTTRYSGGGDCTIWANEMKDVYDNYYSIKEDKYETSGEIMSRISSTGSDINDYKTAVQDVGDAFDSAISSLKNISSSVTDPKYGLIAGFNCKIFGEDLQLLTDTFCVRFFTLFFFLRLVLGAAAFSILFTMCCSVCAGVRHFKKYQRQDRLKQYQVRKEDTLQEIHDRTHPYPAAY